MTQYDGRHPPVFPNSVTIAADDGPPTAAVFNPGLQGVADGMYFLKALAEAARVMPVVLPFLAGATFTIPANALPYGFYDGSGGGGRGGAGSLSGGVGTANAGGGGGGGAKREFGLCPLVPGSTYQSKIGHGGDVLLFGLGSPGGDTTLERVIDGFPNEVVVCLRGAAGGHPGDAATAVISGGIENQYCYARGGRPIRQVSGVALFDPAAEASTQTTVHLELAPQVGGLGTAAHWLGAGVGGQSTSGCHGNGSPSFDGGVPGVPGANNHVGSDTVANRVYGGGAGGGGGGGPWGAGGKGGNGSNAVTSGVSSAPTFGEDAAANSGAGGGGGGAAGGSPTPGTAGAVGGLGGSGRLYLVYFVPAVLP